MVLAFGSCISLVSCNALGMALHIVIGDGQWTMNRKILSYHYCYNDTWYFIKVFKILYTCTVPIYRCWDGILDHTTMWLLLYFYFGNWENLKTFRLTDNPWGVKYLQKREQEYKIEAIIVHSLFRGQPQSMVCFVRYDASKNIWLAEE